MSQAFSDCWWNDYVGLPYKPFGLTRDGVSCWGLVCLIHEEIFGNKLPKHAAEEKLAISSKLDPNVVNISYKNGFIQVELSDVQSGDVLQMWGRYNNRDAPIHCGVVTVPGSVIHVELGTGSVIENYNSRARVKSRIIGAFRAI